MFVTRFARWKYARVLAVEGRFKGRAGYYDDDDKPGVAIVYFAEPFTSDPSYLLRSWLRKTDAMPLVLARWSRSYPGRARGLDVIVRRNPIASKDRRTR